MKKSDECVKCGSEDIGYRFEVFTYSGCEYLNLTCKVCNYRWNRRPNDFKEKETKPEVNNETI
jgi:hypothetical protein